MCPTFSRSRRQAAGGQVDRLLTAHDGFNFATGAFQVPHEVRLCERPGDDSAANEVAGLGVCREVQATDHTTVTVGHGAADDGLRAGGRDLDQHERRCPGYRGVAGGIARALRLRVRCGRAVKTADALELGHLERTQARSLRLGLAGDREGVGRHAVQQRHERGRALAVRREAQLVGEAHIDLRIVVARDLKAVSGSGAMDLLEELRVGFLGGRAGCGWRRDGGCDLRDLARREVAFDLRRLLFR
jgi:hypothetical protein